MLHVFNYNWKNHKGGKSNLTVGVMPSPSHIPLVRASRRPLPHSRGGADSPVWARGRYGSSFLCTGQTFPAQDLFTRPPALHNLSTRFPAGFHPPTIARRALAHAFPVAKSALLWPLTFIPVFPGPTQMPPPPGNLPLPPEALTWGLLRHISFFDSPFPHLYNGSNDVLFAALL